MTSPRGLHAVTLTVALLLGPAAARAGNHGVNVSIDEGRDPERCDQIAVEIGNRPAARAEERVVVAVEPGKALRIVAPENSGVRVYGSDRADFEVLACKAARSASELARISLTRDVDTVGVHGPSGGDWVGYLIVAAPKTAAVEVSAFNGPVGLSGLSGKVTAHAQNGPISVRDCAGDLQAEAENGPISLHGAGGHLRLSTQNGPISVALGGSSWKGEGLEARAVNGPLSLAIPVGYRSGTVVESLGHSPFQCRGEVCSSARRNWTDDGKSIELGEGPAILRLSTENGPVTIRTGKDLAEEDD